MNIFLSYPASCVCEAVYDSQIVALYVAHLAWAPTMHLTQAWIELGFIYIKAINGARVEFYLMLLNVLRCEFSRLEGPSI